MGICGSNIFNELEKNKDIPITSYDGVECECIVTRVLDGDTVEIVFKRNTFEKHRMRIYGIDAPEIHSKNLDEKECGLHAKQKLEELLLRNKNRATVILSKDDKYGRRLGKLITGGVDVSDYMINKKYVYQYEGATKLKWGDWEFNRK